MEEPAQTHKASQDAFKQGSKLAMKLSQEFDRMKIEYPVVLHAMCHILAGYLLDSDLNVSMMEVAEGKIHDDDDKLKFIIDEVKELAAAGRMKRAEDSSSGMAGSGSVQ